MPIEYPPNRSVSDIVKKLKGRRSRKLQREFKELSKQYWGKLLGDRIWSLEYGECDPGYGGGVSRIPSESIES